MHLTDINPYLLKYERCKQILCWGHFVVYLQNTLIYKYIYWPKGIYVNTPLHVQLAKVWWTINTRMTIFTPLCHYTVNLSLCLLIAQTVCYRYTADDNFNFIFWQSYRSILTDCNFIILHLYAIHDNISYWSLKLKYFRFRISSFYQTYIFKVNIKNILTFNTRKKWDCKFYNLNTKNAFHSKKKQQHCLS